MMHRELLTQSMPMQPLSTLVLLLTCSPLAAQFFAPDLMLDRRMTRVTWIGLSGEQSLAIDYGQPSWRPGHDKFMQGKEATYARLGKDDWTTLTSNVDLHFGDKKVPRGRWHLAAHRDEKQNWSLTLSAADKLDAAGVGAGATIAVKPDLEVPMRLEQTEKATDLLDIRLSSRKDKENVTLTISWGKYRLSGNLVADFDLRKPEGAPEFTKADPKKTITTDSGLQYEQVRAGVGPFPKPTDKVTVHYIGWLADGTTFDSSYQRGEPITFPLNAVVKGWTEGLQLMQPGAVFRLTIPPALGYGENGAGDVIPPNATLVFTVALLAIGD